MRALVVVLEDFKLIIIVDKDGVVGGLLSVVLSIIEIIVVIVLPVPTGRLGLDWLRWTAIAEIGLCGLALDDGKRDVVRFRSEIRPIGGSNGGCGRLIRAFSSATTSKSLVPTLACWNPTGAVCCRGGCVAAARGGWL